MKKEDLLKIIGEDELGLLQARPIVSGITADQRLISSFEEINNFVHENNREPEVGNGVQEHRLATRLQSIRRDEKKRESLMGIDQFSLLNIRSYEASSVNDIIQNDDLGILNNEEPDLFDIKHVPQGIERKNADLIERRKPCKNFKEYEDLFKQCQSELASGKRKIKKFSSEREILKDCFYVLNGMLLLIVKVGKTHTNKYGKLNGRQKCIFENGTESEMLIRSLVQRLYENGYVVSESVDTDERKVLENFSGVTDEDRKTGFIYIVKSLSKDPKIQSIENLYKIGFSTVPVEERILHADKDPTYFMAPVSIISTYECFNFNPQKLEQLLHNFFGSACLNFDIFGKDAKRYTPREWFVAPLGVIEKSIELIISGGIVNFRYDAEKMDIVLR